MARLPDKLLDTISNHLLIPEYLSFGQVCQNWRSFFLATNKTFLTSLAPLVCYISSHDEKSCLFYDISHGNTYQTKLPDFAGKFCIGLSNGRIIMEEPFKYLWFINPVTGQQLFSSLPRLNYYMDHSDQFILASAGPNQDTLIVVLSRSHYCIWFRRLIGTQWSAYNFVSKAWILDMVVFNDKIFVITTEFQIGILSLRSSDVRFLDLRGIPHKCWDVKFVTSNGQLFVVDFLPLAARFQIFNIDFAIMAWVKVDNLGDKALFLGDRKGIGISNTTRWGGGNNCAYYLPSASNKVHVYSCTNGYSGSIPIFEEDRDASTQSKCWYFLNQSYNMDCVSDE